MLERMDMNEGPCANDLLDVHIKYDRGVMGKTIKECSNKEIGNFGEDLTSAYLEDRGYTIVDRNWRCSFGEVDIIARDGRTTVLVEVKTRKAQQSNDAPFPEIAVDSRKMRRYRKLAMMYLSWHANVDDLRFDVVAVRLAGECDTYLRHYVGAFGWE